MLLSFSCSNFCSIKDQVSLSMLASSDSAHEEALIPYDRERVLRAAAIYGPNGSGKSNFIDAVSMMQNFVSDSVQVKPGLKLNQYAHKLSAKEEPTRFDIQFTVDSVRYAYGFSYRTEGIEEEYFYYFPSGRKTMIFERSGMEVTPGYRFRGKFKTAIADVLRENRLLLSCAANFSNVPEAMAAYLFFDEELTFYSPEANNWRGYVARLIMEEPEKKRQILALLQRFDTGIRDVRVETVVIPGAAGESQGAAEDQPQIGRAVEENRRTRIFLQYDQFETNLINEESKGVQRLFEIVGPVLDILDTGKVLIFDEIEDGLHERVVWELLNIFLTARGDKPAQLLFTTHDTSLLDLELLRRDQIWFTELDSSRSTNLYSLWDIKNVRKDENISKGYISGKYGGIPMLNRELARKCLLES
ncbi:MAG: ATP-binding protein [Lawsonibacter sp.]|nr:ATP-binding protein [Lawsonibacter sp.]